MGIERPDWDAGDSLPVPVETNSAIVTAEEGQAIVADAEANWAGEGSEFNADEEALDRAGSMVLAQLPPEVASDIIDTLNDLLEVCPSAAGKIAAAVKRNPHSLRQLRRAIDGQMTWKRRTG